MNRPATDRDVVTRLVFIAGPRLPKRRPLLALCGKWLNAEHGDSTGLLARQGDLAFVVLESPAGRASLVRDFLHRPESHSGARLLLDEVAAFRWFSSGVVGISADLDGAHRMTLDTTMGMTSHSLCVYTAKLGSTIEAEPGTDSARLVPA
jgi:hypothetical protein